MPGESRRGSTPAERDDLAFRTAVGGGDGLVIQPRGGAIRVADRDRGGARPAAPVRPNAAARNRSYNPRKGVPGRLVGDPYRSRGEAWTWLPRTPPDPTIQAVCPPASRRSSLKSSTTYSSTTPPSPVTWSAPTGPGPDPTAGSRRARRAPDRRADHPDRHRDCSTSRLVECPVPAHHPPTRALDLAVPQRPPEPGLSPAGINSVVHSLWMTS